MDARTPLDRELWLANRRFLYTLFGRAFGDAPTEEFLELLAGDHVRQALACASQEGEQVAGVLTELSAEGGTSPSIPVLDVALDEYTYLFVGPAKPPAPPWESVYVNGEPLLLQESTLDVRQRYRAAGYLPAGYPHVADDHLAIELNFLAAVAGSACEAFNTEGLTDVETLLTSQAEFLDAHVLTWVDVFARRLGVQQHTGSFYPNLARLVAAFCADDRRAIDYMLTSW